MLCNKTPLKTDCDGPWWRAASGRREKSAVYRGKSPTEKKSTVKQRNTQEKRTQKKKAETSKEGQSKRAEQKKVPLLLLKKSRDEGAQGRENGANGDTVLWSLAHGIFLRSPLSF